MGGESGTEPACVWRACLESRGVRAGATLWSVEVTHTVMTLLFQLELF